MSQRQSGGAAQGAWDEGLDAQAHDFRPDLLTIQQSPPSAWPRGLLLGVLALLGAALLWATFAKLDIVATAQGRLVPMSFTKVVQSAEAGVVLDILVKDGDAVTAGQVVLRLDPRMSRSEMVGLDKDATIKRLTLRRIEAELAQRPFRALLGDPPEIAAQVLAQFNARRLAHEDALAQEGEALNKAKADLASALQVLAKLRQTVPLYRQSAEAFDKLLKEGFVGEMAANEKKREFLEREQDHKAQESAVQSLGSVVAASERKLAMIRSSYQSQLENERIEVLTLLNRSIQELDKSTIRSGLLEIKTPSDGIVKDLAVVTKGAVVQAGTRLMHVVPKEEPVQAEVQLSNDDVGFVAVGQTAQIKVAAYPFQKYGLMQGRVVLVAADSGDPNQQQANGLQPLAYRALVSLDSQSLRSVDGRKLALGPGMLVVAEIHQGRRTVMEYLLSPMQKVGAEAARER